MLDIKFIRENKDLIKEAARKKHIEFDVDELLTADDKRRELLQSVEKMRASQNAASERIGKTDGEERVRLIAETRDLKNKLQDSEEKMGEIVKKWRTLMLQVPNIPDMSVPEGASDSDNLEIRDWGNKPHFNFEPKNHADLMGALDMADFERGTKVSGFRGYFLKNDGVRLEMALWGFVLDKFSASGYTPIGAPSLVREANLFGTGHFPHGVEDVYKTQDDLYLSATSEIPLMGMHADEILLEEELPKKYLAFSPCFRREAGSHGKDSKGIYRVHEFFKIEQLILSKAEHADSVELHEELTKNSEQVLQALGIPYRVVINCGGDIGRAHVKTYDIEAWVPSEGRYRESHSSSYYHDFQTRRLNVRYRAADGRLRYCYSLNNTAIATPRILISILENNQTEDGSVQVPEVLRKYMGKDLIEFKHAQR